MVGDMGRAARLILLAAWRSCPSGATALAGEPELIERLPGAIDDHTIVKLDESRAMVAWERDDSRAQETVWASRRLGSDQLWLIPPVDARMGTR
ncbi:MAG: hypothetical protein KAR22_16815 [Gammaproteobacteria bacterium]|nr:hypothetical protein [Gammaproteobacteria bacterium]